MGMSSLTVDRSNDSNERKADNSFDIEGMVFPLLKPILTTQAPSRTELLCPRQQQKDDFLQNIVEVNTAEKLGDDQDGCKTPTSEEYKIPKVLECPPAPRKPRPEQKRKTATLPKGFFFEFPPDMESAFLLYRMSPPRKKLQWSKTISAVALEQNGGHHM